MPRVENEGGLGGDSAPGGVGQAEAAQVDDLIAMHDTEGQAGQAGGLHLRLDEAVDAPPWVAGCSHLQVKCSFSVWLPIFVTTVWPTAHTSQAVIALAALSLPVA